MSKATEREMRSLPREQQDAWARVRRARGLEASPAELRQAHAIFEDLLRRHPDFMPALIGMSVALWSRIEMEPELRESLVKRLDEATFRATQLAPRDGRIWIYRAAALRLQGNLDGAFAAMEEALRADPLRAVTLVNQADLLIHAGRAPEALPLLDRATELDSGIKPAATRCHAYLTLGRDAEAAPLCEAGAAMEPDWRIYMYAAAAHGNAGNRERADYWKRKLLEAYPDVSLRRLREVRFTQAPEGVAQMERWLAGLRKAGIPD